MTDRRMTNSQISLQGIDPVESLTFSPLERRYLKVLTIKTIIAYVFFMALTPLILLADTLPWRIPAMAAAIAVLAVAMAANLSVLPRAFTRKGYAIREHDITYRSGLFFPRVTTIPFGKVQQVSIRQNIFTRPLGLYAVDIVNGAQTLDGVVIPGLGQEEAEAIKSLVTEKTRREDN